MGRGRGVGLELIEAKANKLFCKVIVCTPPLPCFCWGSWWGGEIKPSTKFQIFKNGGLFTKNLVTFKGKDGVKKLYEKFLGRTEKSDF